MSTPLSNQEIWKAIQANAGLLAQLAGRWLDEQEYEDIAEYAAVVKASLPEGATFVKMTKRPFGFTFRMGTMPRLFRQFVRGNAVITQEVK